jgi:hypothetical protein
MLNRNGTCWAKVRDQAFMGKQWGAKAIRHELQDTFWDAVCSLSQVRYARGSSKMEIWIAPMISDPEDPYPDLEEC